MDTVFAPGDKVCVLGDNYCAVNPKANFVSPFGVVPASAQPCVGNLFVGDATKRGIELDSFVHTSYSRHIVTGPLLRKEGS